MMDCGSEGSTSSIYIWGRLLAVGCGMYMAEIRIIWCPTNYLHYSWHYFAICNGGYIVCRHLGYYSILW
ncbi:hypothetical protein BO85DRAFT_42038 [Aspergillus piperis CBS 112811]|uniref:Uncharacterized protein n=1 Tax=Aspergillus piperis CBS 112811 TaxID=1448313 RepID=A0A8G1VKR9_9EURO|nr:hypothetical protein BO85DRAFT_42038 [Aspergillus piperis CBS 112811]RAH56826.1 hypothetical protein BO85DRAFT_42038 [Aspergillus piperis CBS 112811]